MKKFAIAALLTGTSLLVALPSHAAVSAPERFAKVCSACHGNPAMGTALGAPQKGDKAAWAPRVKQGEATLLSHIHNGYKSMPAKGNCPDCTDADYKALIKYMSN